MRKPDFPGLTACLRLMRRHDPALQEEGFSRLRARAAEFVPELMDEFARETDHGLRCWLLELIGEARDPRTLPLLIAVLRSDDERLRWWAIAGLREMGTREARTILFEHRVESAP